MRKIFFGIVASAFFCACSVTRPNISNEQIIAKLNLVNVKDDKVQVSIDPGNFSSESIIFHLPKTVPGTYSEDNYGKLVENFKALDSSGKELQFSKEGENTWKIQNAEQLDKVIYEVNDTYDIEGEAGVFSPTGTNIEEGRNFMLNLHGFVGYFEGLEQSSYTLEITRPESLIPGTALRVHHSANALENSKIDVFKVGRYFEVTDNPIMYSLPDTTSFTVDGMEVLINVYSPNRVYSSNDLKPGIEEMIRAQKTFLGEIDNTDKYAILLYLSDASKVDAKGSGALEHHTSTVVVFPEKTAEESLNASMTDVVSHEFFHILTPLSVHSEEIHNFNYNNPLMSQHLWMYEGVTEYFAHLFQINQGLIAEEDFYDRLVDKIMVASNYDDKVPFTEMSRNILEKEYNETFYNVYHKGALIGMALDIRLRELSNGKMGLLTLMKKLSKKYGKNVPFKDEELFEEIVELTYPEIETFFDTYVQGPVPIPFVDFFGKVGLELERDSISTNYLVKGQIPYIDLNSETGEIYFRKRIQFNSFLSNLGVKGGDILKEINGTAVTAENAGQQLRESLSWKPGQEMKFLVEREGQERILTAITFPPTETTFKLVEKELPENDTAVRLRNDWLYN